MPPGKISSEMKQNRKQDVQYVTKEGSNNETKK